jgi:hypothetical protein
VSDRLLVHGNVRRFAIVMVAAGCGKPSPRVHLAAMRLEDPVEADHQATIDLAADGEVRADGKFIGHVTAAGELNGQSGRQLAAIADDGTLQLDAETFVVRGDRIFHPDGRLVFAVSDDGKVLGEAQRYLAGAQITGPARGHLAIALAWFVDLAQMFGPRLAER